MAAAERRTTCGSIVGMGTAYAIAQAEMGTEIERIRMLQKRLLDGIGQIEQVFINGDLVHRVPHNVNASFNFVEGESLIMGVKGQPGMSDKEISDWMKSSLVGSQSRFRLLRERRLLGAERAAIDRYEGLVAVKGMLLFKLTPNPEFVVANEPLMVSNATDKLEGRPAEIFLYVANKG